ncbi:MAG: preprotein translocase subunit SecE [Thermoflavifilum sp.]|jgi:preprotein translocase subunit SecE|uniref:preprotein translocase subunit SecE n=1 Tax=Thermoflavifilum sp. TaxID=1968839 RepID=UPI0018A423EE|nr:preprotein translocase subunit SecE [Thermoflavifilum sp.]QOR76308.1 MAG: preprotein translocase subunit SecE [Thermoflavifilum sp.]
MHKIANYIQESYHELVHKVSWPSWEQLQSSTMVVLATTILATVIVWLMDLLSSTVLQYYYKLFS